MNIFVLVKQVPDTETKVKPNADASFIDTTGVKWIMNPYDEFAVEQALLVKTANEGSTITVVRVGGAKDTEALRTAMAMGCDEAILIEGSDNLDSFVTAKAIKMAIEKSGKTPDLIFAGKQAVDDDCLQVPQLVAQMLDLPSVTNVIGFEQNGDLVTLRREIEGGAIEVYDVKTPVVVAVTKGINTPRYASLPGIMKAKKKPMANHTFADLGVVESDHKLQYSNFRLPPEKPAGKKFDATDESKGKEIAAEVANLLRNEAKVI